MAKLVARSPEECHVRLLCGLCPACDNDEQCVYDTDGIMWCPECFWSED